ncbi:ABC transporter substrate-binding protein [Streptomyces sp. LX-29]|uniref:ABC transporter substrate-binding protein n=1 Tax=Streptomyces sp. LX-29 TaxID=2900152 RepID=UPI00240D16C5|nr:ABC transporter substrate-binding protein [Streptomyces sp. LX-29]WFB10517.1 ABC transporter substrate-binding protein [Streptomyces sp. LX-29]
MEELGAADPRQVGRYRILARLGAGGMGRVYLGRSTSGRMVAVKVVRAELAEDPDFRRRFAREVEAARRVTGFFTAAVVDADPEGSPAWLATAYVPGLPLDAAIRAHGAWPRRSLLVLGAGLVEALEAIHATGLIHRDLKPSNVLIAVDGPRVIDFGISIATEASVLTRSGVVIGTPGFMSPEQVTGRQIGPASDVFSLGAVLAFAGTGTPPFGIGSPHSVNFRAVYEAPDLQGLPADTDLVARCLEKDPRGRPTVPELLAEYARLLGETDGPTDGGGLPKETAWLPEAVALAVTRPAGSGPAPADASADTPGGADGAEDAGAEGGAGSAPTPPDPRDALAKKRTPAPATPATPAPATPATPPTPVLATPAVTPAAPLPPPPLPSNSPPVPTRAPDRTPGQEPEGSPAPVFGPAAAAMTPQHLGGEPALASRWTPASPATTPGRPAARPGGRARARRIVAIAIAAALVGGGITALVENLGKDKNKSNNTGTGKSRGSSSPSGDTTSAAGFDAAVDKVVNPSSKKGGTLRLATAMDADSWDPARAYYGWVWNVQRLYSRTLLTYDAKPGAKGLELVPDLAEAQPEVSPDGKTYTVRIKSGLKFEDGTPITSQDVKYAIERTFAADVIDGGPTYLTELLDQGQNYRGPYKDSGGTGLKSVEAPDERTLVFRLDEPDSRFPHLLAMGATAPVPKSKDTGARYGSKPVASGPYRFDSYSPGKSLVLVRNSHWNPATDPMRKALPDRIELTVSAAPEQVAAHLMAGTADLDASQVGLPPAASAKLMADPKLKANADAPFSGVIRTVAMVSNTAPFDNKHCRKAVLYAADTTALQTAQGGPTTGSRYGNMLPPTVPGSDAYDPFDLTTGKPRLAKAKEELVACGRPNGFATKLVVRNNRPKDVASAEVLKQALKAAGIQVEIEQLEFTRYLDTVGNPSEVENKGYGLIMTNWGSDYPHGSGFLPPLADGRLILPNSNTNYAQVDDPAINTLFDQATAETDPDKVTELYRALNHRLTDGAHYLPVVAVRSLNYRNPRLTNVYVSRAYGMVDLQAVGVDGDDAG